MRHVSHCSPDGAKRRVGGGGAGSARVRARGAAAMAAVAGARAGGAPAVARRGRAAAPPASEATARRSRATAPAQVPVPVPRPGPRAPRPGLSRSPLARRELREPQRRGPAGGGHRDQRHQAAGAESVVVRLHDLDLALVALAGRLLGLLLRGGRRRRVERIALPELLGARHPGRARPSRAGRRSSDRHRRPTGMRRARRRMSALRSRMQPCETRPGRGPAGRCRGCR